MGCKHFCNEPIECHEAGGDKGRCKGWADPDNECFSVNGSGMTYTPAKHGICCDCEDAMGVYLACLQSEADKEGDKGDEKKGKVEGKRGGEASGSGAQGKKV